MTTMHPRELAILHDAHDLQQSRARLFLQIDALIDICERDPCAFLNVLGDVAAAARYTATTAKDRALWGSLAIMIDSHLELDSPETRHEQHSPAA
jgi:hypothetical protein